MRFLDGLLTARSHLTFFAGLALALGLVYEVESRTPPKIPTGVDNYASILAIEGPKATPLATVGEPLAPAELEAARIAWKYFENNYQAATGLVNSADKYPSTTLWDLGSYAMAIHAAKDMGIIDPAVADERLARLFDALGKLPLVDGKLPNKAYDTRSLKMTNYNNAEAKDGIGWSAIDIARIAVPLTISTWREPSTTPQIQALLSRWKLQEAVENGRLRGAERMKDGSLRFVQEGRFGYEQYAAKSFFLLGLDVSRSLRYDVNVRVTEVAGQNIAYDARLPKDHDNTHNAVLSEPYVLEAIELGLDSVTRPLADSVYRAQKNRFERTGVLTAVSEDNIDRAPYFVYSSVLNGMTEWAAFTPNGEDASAHRAVSLKAAFGWSYIFSDGYAKQLHDAVADLRDAERGYYSGRYEANNAPNKSITANTNGIVLEALWYKKRGALLNSARAK